MTRKILLSFLSGLIIFFITWMYQNSSFSRSVEDKFFKNVSLLWKYQLLSDPDKTADLVFINTGKDLDLVEDTIDYGNIAVSDRSLILQLVQHINAARQKPNYTVLDIQFYYPYSKDIAIDTLLANELKNNNKILIPILRNGSEYKAPLYPATYGSSDYVTYVGNFNKFRILNQDSIKSIPVRMDEEINGTVYHDSWLFARCNGRLSLSAMWPGYFINNDSVMNVWNDTSTLVKNIGDEHIYTSKKRISTAYYNIGELILDLSVNPANRETYFKNKIVIIGNFQEDVHTTPIGKMSGPVILANLYLSLINRHHIISPGWVIILLIVFSVLSYIAWFSGMPKVKLSEDAFPPYLLRLIQKYITYFGCMFLLAMISFFIYKVQVALIFPSLLFAEIEMRHKTKRNIIISYRFYKGKLHDIKNYVVFFWKKLKDFNITRDGV